MGLIKSTVQLMQGVAPLYIMMPYGPEVCINLFIINMSLGDYGIYNVFYQAVGPKYF